MKPARFLYPIWVISLAVGFWAGAASGLIIYRFGGEELPDPPELGNDGV